MCWQGGVLVRTLTCEYSSTGCPVRSAISGTRRQALFLRKIMTRSLLGLRHAHLSRRRNTHGTVILRYCHWASCCTELVAGGRAEDVVHAQNTREHLHHGVPPRARSPARPPACLPAVTNRQDTVCQPEGAAVMEIPPVASLRAHGGVDRQPRQRGR